MFIRSVVRRRVSDGPYFIMSLTSGERVETVKTKLKIQGYSGNRQNFGTAKKIVCDNILKTGGPKLSLYICYLLHMFICNSLLLDISTSNTGV